MSIAEGVTVAVEVHNILKKSGIYEQAEDFLKRRRPYPVLVVGSSGAGKSSLIKSLKGENGFVPRVTGRSDRTEVEKGRLGSAPFEFHVTPGEVLHEAKRSTTIREIMGNDEIGVIDVVSYGYHEPDVDISDVITGSGVKKAFLEQRRELEINSLPSWTEILCGEGGPCRWVITVVSKADLWWAPKTEKEVIDHYRIGDYHKGLGSASRSARVTHSVAPFSSISQPLFGRVRMSGYYSDNLRAQHHNELVALMLRYASAAK